MLFLLALVPAALRATPIADLGEIVQPWTYRSLSGAIELFIDPSERFGRGPGSYRMSRAGEQVWEHMFPFTLRDVVVHDDGSAAGYAYPTGTYPQEGVLVVAVLGPDGGVRSVEHIERQWSVPHGASDPTAFAIRSCGDSFALEVCGPQRGSERWWVYDWQTGRRLREQKEAPVGEARGMAPAPDVEPVPSMEVPELALNSLGRVVFPWPVPDWKKDDEDPGERKHRAPHRAFVDDRGRVWLSEFSTRVLHVFDENGRALFECKPDPKTFRPYRPTEWIAVRRDGNAFLCADQGVEEFGPTGEHVSWVPMIDILPPRWLFQSRGNECWSIAPSGEIELIGADGNSVRHLERGANGRWFQDFWVAAVAPDGRLAALDEPNPGISSRDPSTWVQMFGATGEALRSLRVPDEFNGSTLAFDGRRIALLHGRLLLLLNEDGSPIGRMTFSEELGDPYYLFFSPSGTELWVFPHGRHEMFRFALP